MTWSDGRGKHEVDCRLGRAGRQGLLKIAFGRRGGGDVHERVGARGCHGAGRGSGPSPSMFGRGDPGGGSAAAWGYAVHERGNEEDDCEPPGERRRGEAAYQAEAQAIPWHAAFRGKFGDRLGRREVDHLRHARLGKLMQRFDGGPELRIGGGAGWARLHVGLKARLIDRGELILVRGRKEIVEVASRTHACSSAKPGAAAVPRSALASIIRPRFSRDLTVPTGMCSATDISS